MTYLLTPEEIHNARYDQIAACMNAKEIAEDWCRRQAKKIVTIMGPAIGLLIDDNTPCKDGSVPVFQRHLVLLAHYWAELENAVGVFRSSQVNAAGKGCPGKAPDGTCDATEAPCGPGSRTGCFAGATHKCYYCDHILSIAVGMKRGDGQADNVTADLRTYLDAEHAKTLKAVAERLGEVCQNEGHPDYQTTRIYCDCCLAELIDCGERGKMPGEEK